MCLSPCISKPAPLTKGGAAGAPIPSSTLPSPEPEKREIWIPGSLGRPANSTVQGAGALCCSPWMAGPWSPVCPGPGCQKKAPHCPFPPLAFPCPPSWLSTLSTDPEVPLWAPSCPRHTPRSRRPVFQASFLLDPAWQGHQGGEAPLPVCTQQPGPQEGLGACELLPREQTPLRVSLSAGSGSGRMGSQQGDSARRARLPSANRSPLLP